MMGPTTGSGSGRTAGQLLRDRTYGPYFFGQLISNCGSWFQNIAMAVVVFNLTGSALLVGTVNVAQFAATLTLAPYAGAITDRVDRRRMLMVGQVVSFMGAAPLAVWVGLVGAEGLPGVWPVLAAALIIGVGISISTPTMQALVPALVPPEDLDQTVALNSATFNVGRTLGPALAAATLAVASPAVAFGVNAFTFVVLFCVLLFIRPREVVRNRGGKGSVREGLAYVRRDRPLALLLLAVAGLGFAGDPVNTLTPSLAARFGGSDALVGVFVGAYGAGAVVGTVLVGHLRRRITLHRIAYSGLSLMGIGLCCVAISPNRWTATAAFAVTGTGFLLSTTGLTTRIQQRVPEDFRGRVLALWSVAFLGSRPLAALLDGALADLFGVRLALLAGIGIAFGAALLVFRGLRPSPDAALPPPA